MKNIKNPYINNTNNESEEIKNFYQFLKKIQDKPKFSVFKNAIVFACRIFEQPELIEKSYINENDNFVFSVAGKKRFITREEFDFFYLVLYNVSRDNSNFHNFIISNKFKNIVGAISQNENSLMFSKLLENIFEDCLANVDFIPKNAKLVQNFFPNDRVLLKSGLIQILYKITQNRTYKTDILLNIGDLLLGLFLRKQR